jgi:catechol 2,3-dioxygenase-like lactoylglutathione lyase family enzyme
VGLHHLGIRVASLDRAVAFYAALGAAPLNAQPIEVDGRTLRTPGTARMVLLAFPEGNGLELFEFPTAPPPPDPDARTPHLGIQVSDVDDALARAETAGGARLWREPAQWGAIRVVYLRDPDGTVLELLNGPLSAVAANARTQREGTT